MADDAVCVERDEHTAGVDVPVELGGRVLGELEQAPQVVPRPGVQLDADRVVALDHGSTVRDAVAPLRRRQAQRDDPVAVESDLDRAPDRRARVARVPARRPRDALARDLLAGHVDRRPADEVVA